MSSTLQKLEQANILLSQARSAHQIPSVFIANLNAFVEAGRSVTFIMQKEFASRPGFEEWYKGKIDAIKADTDFQYFSNLRTETVHITPFRTPQRITTTFGPSGLILGAGTKAVIPLGRVSEYGTIIPADDQPAIINGQEVKVQRETKSVYQFSDRPEEDALRLCEHYLTALQSIVSDCAERFS